MRTRPWPSAAVLLLCSLLIASAAHAQFRMVEIRGPADMVPTGINSAGMVVGFTERGTPANQPWCWSNDTLTILPAPNGTGFATGVNDSGVVVGYAFPAPTFNAKPYRWVNGSEEQISIPGYVRGWAWAINDSGEVLLELATSTQGGLFALWKNGSITLLPAVGAPRALNNREHLAGALGADAIAWLPGGVTLGRSGYLSAEAFALNDSDRIVGRALTQVGGPFEAVYWDGDGEPSPIPGMTEAHSVNRDGVIAGFSDEGPSVVMADTVLRLQSLISEDSPLDLTNVAAWINDGGSVVCAAYDSDEDQQVGLVFVPDESPLVINDTRDLPDFDPEDGVCDADANEAGPQCTLRAAIETANQIAGRDSIPFRIPGAGPHAIVLGTPLPAITEPLVLDGSTQEGWEGLPVVQVTGASGDGFVLPVGESALRALAIGGFPGAGVKITGPGTNRVIGCAIGVSPAGTPTPNGVGVLVDGSAGNWIGGPGGRGNVVSGNLAHGVHVRGAAAQDNQVVGNHIGIDAEGVAALANGGSGVRVEDAPRTTVGGADDLANVVSGNGEHGVHVSGASSGTRIAGNRIGTSADGTTAIGNGSDDDATTGHVGVLVEHASSVAVGGAGASGNLISGNVGGGVRVNGDLEDGLPSLAFELSGNRIGTNADADELLPNGGHAVLLFGAVRNARIGKPGAGNVVCLDDVTRNAIELADRGNGGAPDSTRVQANRIGVSLDGTHVLGNAYTGIGLTTTSGLAFSGASQLRIGGAGAGNVIASTRRGIYLTGAACEDLQIVENIVGIRPDGALAGGTEGQVGILVVRAPQLVLEENTVGGQQVGVVLATDEATVTGNRIGTNPAGSSARPNQVGMIVPGEITLSGGSPIPFGDDNAFVGNVISGNTLMGVLFGGALDFSETNETFAPLQNRAAVLGSPDRNTLVGNRIGTDASGLSALGNGANDAQPGFGVWLSSGAENVLLGNVLSGNGVGLFVGGAPDDRPRPHHTRFGGNIVGGTLGGGVIPNRAGGVLIDRADDTVIAPAPVVANGPDVPNLFQGNLGDFAIGVVSQGATGVRNVVRKGVFTGNVGPSIVHIDADHPGQRPAGVPAPPTMLSSIVENDQLSARVMPQVSGAVDVYLSQNCVGGIAQGFHVLTLEGVTGVGADLTLPAPPGDPQHARAGWFLATTSTRSGSDSTTSAFSTCLPIATPADTAFGAAAEGDTGLVLSGAGVDLSVNSPPPPLVRARGSLPGFFYAQRHHFAAPNDSIAGSASAPSGLVVSPDVVAPDRYWTIAQEGLDGSTCTVCLDASVSEFAHPQQVVIVRRDRADQPWTPIATSLDTGSGRLCAAQVTAFGEFSVAADSSNLTTATELALSEAEAAPGRVTLTWHGAGAEHVSARVERIEGEFATPTELGTAALVDRDQLRWIDEQVTPGRRYGYRLAYEDAGRIRRTVWTWVDVPALAAFALESMRPNPTSGPREVVFSLAQDGLASLELYDVGGRRVWSHQATYGAGRHVVALPGAPVSPGIYLVRLTQSMHSAVKRGVIVK